MGGSGSGRWGRRGKATTTDHVALDIRKLGQLVPGYSANLTWSSDGRQIATTELQQLEGDQIAVRFDNKASGASGQVEAHISLDWTYPHLGGRRAWFSCECGRRVALLYFKGGSFACRQCCGLAYDSQRAPSFDRAATRANRIRKQLRWEPGLCNGYGTRPRGMHRRTFARLCIQHDALADLVWEQIEIRLSRGL